MRIGVIIPALNEEACIAEIVRRCTASCPVGDAMRVVVCDNGSIDSTAIVATQSGAEVVQQAYRGYGAACLTAIAHLTNWPDVLLFIDADGSSSPEEMELLIEPIRRGESQLVLGVRELDSESSTAVQRFGSRLAVALINLMWKGDYRDMGPFRAIQGEAYSQLRMTDRTWGWTVEMQIKAIAARLKVGEIDVSWNRRLAGQSKISGSLMGVIRAGARIMWTIGSHRLLSLMQRGAVTQLALSPRPDIPRPSK